MTLKFYVFIGSLGFQIILNMVLLSKFPLTNERVFAYVFLIAVESIILIGIILLWKSRNWGDLWREVQLETNENTDLSWDAAFVKVAKKHGLSKREINKFKKFDEKVEMETNRNIYFD